MDFGFTDEQRMLREMVVDFVERECPKPVARELEASGEYPAQLAAAIARAGLNGIGVPEEFGGQGGDIIDQCIVCEELSRSLGGLAWLWGITVWSGAKALLLHGSPQQREDAAAEDRRRLADLRLRADRAGRRDRRAARDAHARPAGRRRLRPAREQDLVDARARRRPDPRARAHVRRGQALARPDDVQRRRALARAGGGADPEARHARSRLLRGLLRRRLRARRRTCWARSAAAGSR